MAIVKTLAALEETMRKEAEAVRDLMNGEASLNEVDAQKEKMNAAVTNYNKFAAEEAYRKWAAEGNPVKTALQTLYIPEAKSVRIVSDKDTGVADVKIESKKVRIDLCHLQKTVGVEHFADKMWLPALQRLCLVLEINLKKDLDIKVDDSEHYKVMREMFHLAPDADLTSNNTAQKALQTVVDMILFEGDEAGKNKYVVSKPWYWFIAKQLNAAGKKTNQIKACSSVKMMNLVTNVIYNQLNGLSPEVVAE